MKITFVEPKAPGLHIWTKVRLPRLGPLLLATTLSRRGHDAKVVFEEGSGLHWRRLFTSDVVALSTITSTAPRAYQIADKLRARGVVVIMGGAHPTFLPNEAMGHADYICRGEADLTIVPLMEALKSGRGFDRVPGLSFRKDGMVVHNTPAQPVPDLDQLPVPDLSLLLEKPGFLRGLGRTSIVPIQTSRGCPHDCSFCSVTGMFGRKYRFRSTESVLRELESHNLEHRHLFFYDDNFAANPKRTAELLQAIVDSGLKFRWSAQVHTDCARHPELLQLMKQAGCDTLYIGLESINPKTLRAYKKTQTVQQMEAAVAAIHSWGIGVHGMFVFGSDEDDAQTIRQTALWAKQQNIATVQFLILTPLPGTRTHRELETDGRLVLRDWSLYDTHHVVFRPKKMTPKELQVETYRAQGSFYSLRRVLQSFATGDPVVALIRLYAHNLNRKWLRAEKSFLKVTDYLGATE